jgi:WD40 repeat protein
MEDKRMFVWDLRSGTIVTSCSQNPSNTTCAAFGGMVRDIKNRPTNYYQLATAGEKALFLWALDPVTGEMIPTKVQQQAMRNITSLQFSEDCTTIYAGTTSGDFSVINVKNKVSGHICPTCSMGVLSIINYTDEYGSQWTFAGGGDGTVTKFDETCTDVAQAQLPGGVVALSLSPDNLEIIAGTQQGFVFRLRTKDLSELIVCENHSAGVIDVSYPPEASDRFATVSLDNSIRVWDASDYSVVAKAYVKDAKSASSIVYSLDVILSGWEDGRIRCHHPETCEFLWHIDNAHFGGVTALLLSNNQRFCISGGFEGEVRVWEMRSKELVSHLKEHTLKVTSLSLFGDDAHCLSCSRDRSFLCWDLRRERRVSNHTQRMGGLNAVALSKDQTQVLTIGQEKKVTYWDLREENPLRLCQYPRGKMGGDANPAASPGWHESLDDECEAHCIAVMITARASSYATLF